MNKGSISLFALIVALGSSDDLHADARSVLSKLNLGNTSSSSSTSQNEAKLKEQISQLKAQLSTLRQALTDPALQKEFADLQGNVDKIAEGTPLSIIVQLQGKIERLKQKNKALKAQQTAPAIHSNDPTTKAHISKLEAEILLLKTQLAMHKGEENSAAEQNVKKEAEKFLEEMDDKVAHLSTLDKQVKTTEIQNTIREFSQLLQKAEAAKSIESILLLAENLVKKSTRAFNEDEQRLFPPLLDELLKSQLYKQHSDNINAEEKKKNSELWNSLIATTKINIEKNPVSMLQQEPLAILLFINNTQYLGIKNDIQKVLTQLSAMSSLDVLKAIYSHLHSLIGTNASLTPFLTTWLDNLSIKIHDFKQASQKLEVYLSKDSSLKSSFSTLINYSSYKENLGVILEATNKLISKQQSEAEEQEFKSISDSPHNELFLKVLEEPEFEYLNRIEKKLAANAAVSFQSLKSKSTTTRGSEAVKALKLYQQKKNKRILTSQQQQNIIDKFSTIVVEQSAEKIPTAPPPPPPNMNGGNNSQIKVYKIGDPILMSKTLKDEVLATIKGRENQITTEINKNKNKAKELKDKLEAKKTDLALNEEEILAVAYAVSTAPEGKNTKNDMRIRIQTIIELSSGNLVDQLKHTQELNKILKEIYP